MADGKLHGLIIMYFEPSRQSCIASQFDRDLFLSVFVFAKLAAEKALALFTLVAGWCYASSGW